MEGEAGEDGDKMSLLALGRTAQQALPLDGLVEAPSQLAGRLPERFERPKIFFLTESEILSQTEYVR